MKAFTKYFLVASFILVIADQGIFIHYFEKSLTLFYNFCNYSEESKLFEQWNFALK